MIIIDAVFVTCIGLFISTAEVASVGNQCGYVFCLNETGIACLPDQSVCVCPDGLYGNGRFACINKATQSLCTIYGDPHVILFDQAKLSVPLPCRHVISDFETPDGCKIKVTGFTAFVENGDWPAHVYEAGFELEGVAFSHNLIAGVDSYGFFSKSVVRQRGVMRRMDQTVDMLTEPDNSGFYDMFIPQCAVKASYRPMDSAINIIAPVGTVFNGGVCGVTNDSISNVRTHAAALGLDIDQYSIYTFAEQMDNDYEFDQSCLDFSSVMRSCSTTYKVNAVRFCSSPFYNQLFGETLMKYMEKKDIFTLMNSCLRDFCSTGKSVATCSTFKRAFDEFPQPTGLEEIQPFC